MTLRIRRSRSNTRRDLRLHKRYWQDPYPQVPGTKPEKMLFAALIARGIFFEFQEILPEWRNGEHATLSVPAFVPDFIIPTHRVILDPWSDYHHTLADSIERDAYKAALYLAEGYAYVHPWASEVEKHGGQGILSQIPELRGPPRYPLPADDLPYVAAGWRRGRFIGLGATSVAAANRRRPSRRRITVKQRR